MVFVREFLGLFLVLLGAAQGARPRNSLNTLFDHDVHRTLTAGDMVRAVSPKIPEALVPHARLERLIGAANAVPLYPLAGVILEVRGAEGGDVDLSVATRLEDEYGEPRATLVDMLGALDKDAYEVKERSESELAEIVGGKARDAAETDLRGSLRAVRTLMASSSRWAKVAAVMRRYRENAASLRFVWEDAWLEFDIPGEGGQGGAGSADGAADPVTGYTDSASDSGAAETDGAAVTVPEPSVFLGPAKMSPNRDDRPAWSKAAKKFMLEFVRMYAVMTGGPLPREAFTGVLHAIDEIPSEGELHQLGVWLSRGSDGKPVEAVRIITMMPARSAVQNVGAIERYITALGYSHVDAVMPRVTKAAQFVDEIIVSADVWATAGPRIGFECFLQKRKGKMFIWQRVVTFVAWLVREGLVTEAKAKALREFMGFDRATGLDRGVATHTLPLRAWGNDDAPVGSFDGKVSRSVNHIKLVYDPVNGWEAKFYLWVTEVPGEKRETVDPEDFLAPGHDAVSNDATELVI